MDRGKRGGRFFGSNNKIYLDLKDIIREHALQFLPAKSLFRCTVVCRDWKFMISTPFFAHNQSNSFRAVSGFFCRSPHKEPSFISLDQMAYGVPDPSLKFLPEPVDIRSSCNGLLCCQGRTGYRAYYICNPVTKHFQKLPKPENNHGSDPAVVLVFEPSQLNFMAEYKLVCAFPSELDGYEFEIFSSSTRSWKTSGEIIFNITNIEPNSGVYASGTIYWSANGGKILAFDLSSERTQLLYSYGGGYGYGYDGYSSRASLGEMNGKLCAASVRRLQLSLSVLVNPHTNTMQMGNHTKAWDTRNFTLDSAVISGVSHDHAVQFVGNNTVLLRAGGVFYAFDIKTKETKCLNIESNNLPVVGYMNSLVDI